MKNYETSFNDSLAAKAFDESADPSVVVDAAADRIIAANQAARAKLGKDADLLGTSFLALHAQQKGQLIVFTDAVLTLGEYRTRTLSPAMRDAGTLYAEYHARRLDDIPGHEGLILITITDVAQRRQRDLQSEAEEQLHAGLEAWQRSERVFQNIERQNQLILRAAGDGIFGVNTEGRTTFVNPAAARMLGFEQDELMGCIMHATVHHHHADGSAYPMADCPIYAAFRDGAIHSVTEEVFWMRDGTPLWVEYTSTPIYDHGVLIGAVIIFRDITGRREADARLREALAEVERLRADLELENAFLKEEMAADYRGIIGDSLAIQRTLRQIEAVAPTDATVLIFGESGTGKELIARAIHEAGMSRSRPMVRVNCASVSREQFEIDFFGYAKGAFAGATKDKPGRFEMAYGGTIFLDEVAELPLDLQGKILRLVQDGQVERIGDTRPRTVSARIIASTNRNLAAEVRKGSFRQDLYFRLNVFPIEVAPLRDRREDIPALAFKFLREAGRRLHSIEPKLSEANLRRLVNYSWPGNVRELQNVLERAVILSGGGRLTIELPTEPGLPAPRSSAVPPSPIETEVQRRARERRNIEAALTASGGKVSGPGGAAERLGMKPTTLASRMKAMDISVK
jgi:PAS domain S-box-containing protein